MTIAQVLHRPQIFLSLLEYVFTSWNAIKYMQDELREAKLCAGQNLGGRLGLHSS